MKKRLITTITVLCLLCGFFVPVRVHADGQTYVEPPSEREFLINVNGSAVDWYGQINNGGSRLTYFGTRENGRLYIVSKAKDDLTRFYMPGGYSIGPSASRSWSYNGETYYVGYIYQGQGNLYSTACYAFYDKFGASFNGPGSEWTNDTAIYYTFGAGAVGPLPPGPDYGNLIDVRFNTDIAGSGTAAVNNIDRIKWNPDNDSNGITFDGSERVEIQAIPGNYTAESRESLLSLGVSSFDYDADREHLLAELPIKNGEYTVTWGHVIQQLNAGSISDFLGIRKSSDTWLKSGWIYQIRMVAGNYTSEWQTIYNATSSGVQNSLTVENSTEINMDLINVIQSINTTNNSQYENWTINNITINMENSDGQQTTDKPWWAYLLEAIVKAFGDILTFLGKLIGDLMDAITDLFKPAEFTINEYNDFKVELKQNSGLFGQAIDFTTDLKNTFMGVQYQEPILHWQGISLDGIVFIPAADYNLNEYVTMWGLGDFRQIAYICSDGFIFFSLLLLIIRKLNEVLKK